MDGGVGEAWPHPMAGGVWKAWPHPMDGGYGRRGPIYIVNIMNQMSVICKHNFL